MAIALPKLPYAYDALEPHISGETMKVHHDKHHKTYVDKVNAAIKDTAYADLSLNEIVAQSHSEGDTGVFNNAAQAWNHGFYWHCLSAEKGHEASDALMAAVNDAFGSVDGMHAALEEEGAKHFGSGWVWLVSNKGKLEVISTHDAETPIAMNENMLPLFTLDLWEHAYYLDQKNERPKYLKAALKNMVNWDFVNANFASSKAWEYPAS